MCSSVTDIVADFSKKIKADIYINVQGDEPLINAHDIKKPTASNSLDNLSSNFQSFT